MHAGAEDLGWRLFFVVENAGALEFFFKVARSRELPIYGSQAVYVATESAGDMQRPGTALRFRYKQE